MSSRCFAYSGMLASSVIFVLVAALPSAGQGTTVPAKTKKTAGGTETSAIPRTPDGRPDLQGIWNFSSGTPMERPQKLGEKNVLTDEEAAEFEQELAAERAAADSPSATAPLESRVGYEQRIWFERGETLTEKRTALVVDPPDGRIPPLTTEAQKRVAARAELLQRGAYGPEDRNLAERCILGFNSGPPMVPSAYNNNVQVFQTRDYVVLLNEMVHNARIIPLDRRPHLPPNLRQWVGDSRARWEKDTLVIETMNFLRETALRASSANTHLVERFTRVDADTLLYEFTITDPTTWAKPWTVQVPMRKVDQPLYEYACHEGNYAMPTLLSGARALERAR